MEINNQIIISTFMSNFENNLFIFSTLLAISRRSDAVENTDILQAYEILSGVFMNISSWIETERSDDFKSDRELVRIANELKDKDGWVKRSVFVKKIINQCKV